MRVSVGTGVRMCVKVGAYRCVTVCKGVRVWVHTGVSVTMCEGEGV